MFKPGRQILNPKPPNRTRTKTVSTQSRTLKPNLKHQIRINPNHSNNSKQTHEKISNLDQDGVAAEELQLLHSVGVERHHGVIIVHRFVDDEPIGGLLPLQNRRTVVPLRSLAAKPQP